MKNIPGRILFPEGVETRKDEIKPRPDEFSDYWFSRSAYDNSTGMDVNEDAALKYATVWACVKVISEDLASLPLFVYRRDGKKKERATDHPVNYLLHDAPNEEMTAMQFRESMESHLLTWGNAYAQIQRNMRGEPIALWPLHPGQITPVRDNANKLQYKYRVTNTGEEIIFRNEEILHIPGLGFNGIVGYSPISYQREVIGSGLAAQQFKSAGFKDGNRLQLAFVHPAANAPKQEGRDAFAKKIREEYSGQNGKRIGVLWEGMTPHPINMTAKDAEFIEQYKLTKIDICSIYRVPPHKVMDLERATFSNIEQQSISYVVDTIRPWAVRWEQAINSKLLNNSSKYFSEHLVDGLLRGDIKSRYDAYAVGRQWGWLSINDIRILENMNPVPDGDDYLQPMNMIPVGEEPKELEKDKPAEEKLGESDENKRTLRLIEGK